MKIDAAFTGQYFGLLQTSATNANDGEFFWKEDMAGVYSAGSGGYRGAVNHGAWVRVVLTYDGSDIRIYFNGALQGSPYPRPTSTHTITVGRTAADVLLMTD